MLNFATGIIKDWRDLNALEIIRHPWFISAFVASGSAQLLKLAINWWRTRNVELKYLHTPGGMPSAHTAMVTALTTSVGLTEGFGSPVAMVALGFTAVTMFDAATVRRAAGEQAKVLNRIVKAWRQEHHLPSVANLKELLGHTRTEVFGGLATGVATAIVVCYLWR